MRMCAVTREKLPKKELLRFVLNGDGKLVLDKGERVRGRGINIKPDLEVIKLGIKNRIFERILKIKLSEQECDKLIKESEDYIDTNFREKRVVRIKKEDLEKIYEK